MRTFSKIASFCAVALTLGSAFAQTTATKGQSTTTSKPKTTTAAKPATTTKPAAATALTTDEDKFSYAVGMSIARTLKQSEAKVNPEILTQGLKDETAGTAKLTPQEAQEILTKVQGEMRAKALAHFKEQGDAFLAENKTKPGVVTLPDGLQYKIVQAGTGPKPAASDTVSVNYTGKLVDGKVFDASASHGGPAEFQVGQVIKGWTEALQLMPVGSKWQLYIPSNLAYGERGAGGDIPPNSALVFDVELLSIKTKEPALQPGPDSKPTTPQPSTPPNPEQKKM